MISFENKQVVVTGAGGFIGSHLVERLLALGASVTAFVRYTSRNDAGFLRNVNGAKEALRIVAGDVRELETVRGVVKGADAVFHLAALVGIPYSYVHANEVVDVNTIGTLNVLLAAREYALQKVVIASSSEVYGSAIYAPIDENHRKQPQSPYSASKIAADALAMSFYYSFGLPVAIVRPFNTYGPRQSDRAVIPAIISQALTRKLIRLGNTAPTRDFTFVTDTAEGILRMGQVEASVGQEINLGSGQEISIGDLAAMIARLIGDQVEIRYEPERSRPGKSEVVRLLSANSKARELLGWTPRVGLEEGLRATIDWVRDHADIYAPNGYRI